jgi:uncharacterized protein
MIQFAAELTGQQDSMRLSFMKVKCPVCRKEAEWEGNPYRPFCSERCKNIDLASWASGEYRIAGDRKDEDEGDNGSGDF